MAIIGIFLAVWAYITVSHSLDLTASDIDTNVGQLDGYLTIVFDGDNTPRPKKVDTNESILQRATEFFTGENNETKTTEPQVDKNIKTEIATPENVRDFYREKDSTVCRIKCSDYSAYTEGEVFERGFWKVGVISIIPEILNEQLISTVPTLNIKKIQEKIYKLRYEDEVDLVLVTCIDQKISKYLDKVDCYICKIVSDEIPNSGKIANSSFIMRTPDLGVIGAILSSPAKMLSGHIYTKVEIPPEN